MSSRIRGRRYRNVDPDERYGFTTAPASIVALGPAVEGRIVEVVSLDGTPLDGTTVTMGGTSVSVEPGAPFPDPSTILLEPRTVTGPQQTAG